MSRRKLTERNIRNIQKSQSTYYISIPIEFIKELEWQERQKVVVSCRGKTIIIKDWEK